jgi:hypothetical protein
MKDPSWEEDELTNLKKYYSSCTNEELVKMFPNRTLLGICKKARKIGLKRSAHSISANRSACQRKRDFNHAPRYTAKGYKIIYAPDFHRADKNGMVLEHIYIFEKETGVEIPKGYCIHHINGKKDDNRIENLCMLSTSAHTILHNSGKKFSDERKSKISKAAKERLKTRLNHPRYKSVDLSEIDNLIKSGVTVTEACKMAGIDKTTYYHKKKVESYA